MQALYDELIAPETASALLGKKLDTENVTCKLITTLNDVTVLIHDNKTGAEVEHRLDGFDKTVGVDVDNIEKTCKETFGMGSNMLILREFILTVLKVVAVSVVVGLLVYFYFN